MKRHYKMTIKTADLFNFTTSVVIRQYDARPKILKVYESTDGQLIDLWIYCTPKERLVIGVALDDYILRLVPTNENARELSFGERLWQGWI